MKSLDSSASDSDDHNKPSTSAAKHSPPQLRAGTQPSTETNGEARVSAEQVVAGSIESPDAESESDTDSDDSEETTDSESTVSADDNPAAENAADFTTQTSSSTPVM